MTELHWMCVFVSNSSQGRPDSTFGAQSDPRYERGISKGIKPTFMGGVITLERPNVNH